MITTMARENNQTLIIVTHDYSIAKYADKIVHILDGNIEKIEINTKMEGSTGEKVTDSGDLFNPASGAAI